MKYYTEEHEWVEVIDDEATIGISEYAAEQLGEVSYVELPEDDDCFNIGDRLGEIESEKTSCDIYSPISGTICAVNDALASWDVEGVTGWRLPNEDEVAFIRENATVINEAFSADKRAPAFVQTGGTTCYFYDALDGNIMSFTVVDLPAGWSFDCSTSNYLRPITKITFE